MKKRIVFMHFYKLIMRLRPSYVILVFFGALAGTAVSVLGIYTPKLLLDGIGAEKEVKWFVILILILASANLILRILLNYLKKKQDMSGQLLKREVELAFSSKVMSVDYRHLEDSKYLDMKERAIFAINNFGALDMLLESSLSFVSSLLTLGTVVGIMVTFSPVYMLISLSIAVLTIFVQRRYLKAEQEVLQELIPINRQYNYYFSNVMNPEAQKDIRIYRLDKMLISKLAEKNLSLSKWLGTLQTKGGNSTSIQTAIIGLIHLLTYVYASLRVLTDRFGARIGIGDFTVYISTSEQLINSFRSSFRSLMNVNQQLGHLTPFAEFIQIPESDIKSIQGSTIDEIQSVEFRNVSFQYPSSEKMILKNISFTINKGERISIVGLNNAGKSTIVKLLCRLFEPTGGEILINGIPIGQLRHKDYLAQIATVFQDFKLFPFTIEENINSKEEQIDKPRLEQILADLDLTVRMGRLEKGVKSLLDKSIYDDAVDMSGGEKQKVAIARALYKASSLIILDEPTAALDPLAEAEIYESFNELVKDQTAIYISHRMSSSIFCDKILLLQDGEVVAFNSHGNLMKSNNLYSELFHTQAAHYQQEAGQ